MAVQAQRECRNIYFTPLVHSMYALHLRRWLRIFPREPCSRVKRALQTEAERAHCHLLEAPSSSRPGYSGAPE